MDEGKKRGCDLQSLGMILYHNGIVLATTKDGNLVKVMKRSYNEAKLGTTVQTFKKKDGMADIRVWINEGVLQIGDDIMNVCVAGRFRMDVLPSFARTAYNHQDGDCT